MNEITAPQAAALLALKGTSKMAGFRSLEGQGISGAALRALINKGLVIRPKTWSTMYTGSSYALTFEGHKALKALYPTPNGISAPAPAKEEPLQFFEEDVTFLVGA